MEKKNMILKIKPNDNWFVNNGRPFEERDEGWIESAIFPTPSVFYGSLFSSLLFQNQCIKNRILGNEKIKDLAEYQKNILEIKNIYLYDEEEKEVYIKAPLDLYIDEEKKAYKYSRFLEVDDKEGNILGKNILIAHPPQSDYFSYERADDYYIKLSKILGCYADKKDNLELKKSDYFISNSYKVGIKIDKDKGVAEDGYLYRLDFKEFKKRKFAFLLEINLLQNINFNGKGALKLGGEGKTAYYDVIYDGRKEESKENKKPYDIRKFAEEYNETKIKSNEIKMILLTPLIIENNETKKLLKCEGNEDMDILGGVVGKPEYIGGFDIRERKPKNTRRAIPKGSVYIFKLKSDKFKENTLESIEDKIKKYLDIHEDYKGYGKFLIVPVKGEI